MTSIGLVPSRTGAHSSSPEKSSSRNVARREKPVAENAVYPVAVIDGPLGQNLRGGDK
jgi:hypothetical protein